MAKKPKGPKLITFVARGAVRRPDGSILEYCKTTAQGYFDKDHHWVVVDEKKEVYITEQQFYDDVIGPICRSIEKSLPPGSTATYVPGPERPPWKPETA